MKKVLSFAVVVISLFVIASCGSKGKELVSVNGKTIGDGDLNFLATMNPRLKAQLSTPFGKKQILDNLVEQELLYQAALKKGLQRDSGVKAKFDLYKKVLIAQALIENEITKAAKDYYDKNKAEFEKLQLSQIEIKYAAAKKEEPKNKKTPPAKPDNKAVARTKDAALKLAGEIKAKLDKGEVFADVAKQYSEDTISKAMGGDMGKISKNDPRMERRGFGPIIEKAFSMQAGEIAGPIETQEGYHIITVTKAVEVQPYEEAEQAILFKIQGDERNKLMADLKKNAKIVYPGEENKKAEAGEAKPQAGQQPAAESAIKPAPMPTAVKPPAAKK